MRKAVAYFILAFACIGILQPSLAQNRRIDSLLALLKTDKEDSNKVKRLINIARTLWKLNEADKSLNYSKQALSLAQKIHYKKGIASAFTHIGMGYYTKDNFPEAIKYFKKSIESWKEPGNGHGLATSYIDLGGVYERQGNYPDALQSFLSALKISEQDKNKSDMAHAYNNIGHVYFDQSNFNEALKNYRAALRLREETGDKNGITVAHESIGNVFYVQNNYTEALTSFNAALKVYTQLENREGMAYSTNNIGNVLHAQKKYEEALERYFFSLKIFEELDDKYSVATCYNNIGQAYAETKKIKDAAYYLNRSLLLAREIGGKELLRDVYKEMTVVDSTINNYKAAFEHHKLFLLYRDSVTNEESQKKIIQTAMQYEFDKKEAVIKSENDKAMLKLEDENKLHKQQRWFFVGAIILSLILLFLAKRAYDNKRKYSEMLRQENERKEMLLQEVHHRVNNSLQMISSLLNLQADSTTNEEVKEYLLKSENRVHAMSAMHELLHESNTQLQVDIRGYLDKVISFYENVLNVRQNIALETQIPNTTFHSKIALPLALIVNELITNAIKYAFPNNQAGLISISLSQNETINNSWKLKISDNGIGLPREKKPENGSSLGLRLVNIMTQQIGGVLIIENKNGTSFEIAFSVS